MPQGTLFAHSIVPENRPAASNSPVSLRRGASRSKSPAPMRNAQHVDGSPFTVDVPLEAAAPDVRPRSPTATLRLKTAPDWW